MTKFGVVPHTYPVAMRAVDGRGKPLGWARPAAGVWLAASTQEAVVVSGRQEAVNWLWKVAGVDELRMEG
jgi:hypothetical protein